MPEVCPKRVEGLHPGMQPLDFRTPRAGLEPATIRLTAAFGRRLTPTSSNSPQERRASLDVLARERRPRFGVSREEFSDRSRTRPGTPQGQAHGGFTKLPRRLKRLHFGKVFLSLPAILRHRFHHEFEGLQMLEAPPSRPRCLGPRRSDAIRAAPPGSCPSRSLSRASHRGRARRALRTPREARTRCRRVA